MISQISSSPTARRNPYTCQDNLKNPLFLFSFSPQFLFFNFPLQISFCPCIWEGWDAPLLEPVLEDTPPGHPTWRTLHLTPHLKDTLPDPPPQQYLKLTSQPGASLRFVKTLDSPSCQCRLSSVKSLDSPSCQCRLCPKAGGKRAPGPEDRGWKRRKWSNWKQPFLKCD